MSKIRRVFKSVLVWTHDRGTLQYDIICALILVFIFLVPRGCFSPKRHDPGQVVPAQKTTYPHP